MKEFLARFKSWALWLAIASLVAFVLKEVTGIDYGETVNGFMNLLLPILITFGIVNNPTDTKHI